MAKDFCCPVCERHGLELDCEQCPQCDADLTCFRDLESLRKECAEYVSPTRFAGRGVFFVCVFGGVLVLVVVSFFMERFDRRLAGIDKIIAVSNQDKGLQRDISTVRLHISELKINYEDSFFRLEEAVKGNGAKIKRIGSRLTGLEEVMNGRIAAVSEKEKKRTDDTFFYYARKTDTLWAIARRFYGDGKYYPLIMEQNPHLVIGDITPGQRMQIISDPDPVMLADIYSRKTEWKNGMLLWSHVVQPEETRDSIYARFRAPGASGPVFFDDGVKIVPLETIRIILQ